MDNTSKLYPIRSRGETTLIGLTKQRRAVSLALQQVWCDRWSLVQSFGLWLGRCFVWPIKGWQNILFTLWRKGINPLSIAVVLYTVGLCGLSVHLDLLAGLGVSAGGITILTVATHEHVPQITT